MEATFTPETILKLELILDVVLLVIVIGMRAPLELLPQRSADLPSLRPSVPQGHLEKSDQGLP